MMDGTPIITPRGDGASTSSKEEEPRQFGDSISREAIARASGLRLDDGDDEADRGEHVARADTFQLRADLYHGLASVVDLPRQLPAPILGAADRLHELLHHLLERVAVAVVENGHPGRGRDALGALDLLGVGHVQRPAHPMTPRVRRPAIVAAP